MQPTKCRAKVSCLRSFNVFFIGAFPVIILSPRPIPHRFLFRPRFSRVHGAVTLLCKPQNKKKHTKESLAMLAT